MSQQKQDLPKLLPALPEPVKPKNVTGFHVSDAQLREIARIWHINHPEFVIGILRQTGVIKEETPEKLAEAKHYIKEATEIGFFSKADITQYTVACMNAGGSIAHVWTFKEVLVQFTEDTRDVMAQIIDAAPVHYWTYLPGKVKKYDRGL